MRLSPRRRPWSVRRRGAGVGAGLVGLVLLGACTPEEGVDPGILDAVGVDERLTLPGLGAEATVVFTELGVPHVYAADGEDAARVQGFLYARDRLFTMELARRLALGEASGLLGDLAVSLDVESRLTGMTHVAEQLEAGLSAEQRARLQAYAEGVNVAIDGMQAGVLPPPSELTLAGPLLGADDPTSLLTPFEVRDLAGVLATLVYQLAFSMEDLEHEAALAEVADWPDAGAFAEARRQGAVDDLYAPVAPVHDRAGAPSWSFSSAGVAPDRPTSAAPSGVGHLARSLVDRLSSRRAWLGMGAADIRGSNAWAMTSQATGGPALLAGDGHLELTVPSLFWQVGVDTRLLGDGDGQRLLGLGLPGVPGLAVGTNGDVAWSQTRLRHDIVDWYAEELVLDGDSGAVVATVFQGTEEPVTAVDETLEVAGVLGADASTLTFERLVTFDGRYLLEVEGTPVEPSEVVQGDLRLPDGWVRPGDADGDGVVRGISFDYTALDPSGVLRGLDGFNGAEDVAAFREATRFLNGYGQNILAADRHGDVLYTSHQAMPCRQDLAAAGFGEGADPGRVLDGTRFGGFTIPVTEALAVDEDDPDHCVIPFDDHPWEVSPDRGWVMSANQDPGGVSLDGSLFDDRFYLGGPWAAGYRAERIAEHLEAAVADGGADLSTMDRIQDDHQAGDARVLLPRLLAILDAAAQGTAEDAAVAWADDADRLDEARSRLQAWADGGFEAASGVQTAYHDPAPDEADDAVATMLYYAWQRVLVDRIFGDEGEDGAGIPQALWRPYPSAGIPRALIALLDGLGPDDPGDLTSWVPELQGSAFFDDRTTEALEDPRTVVVSALSEALDDLTAPSDGDGTGGFGTADMDAWRWGLRHTVRFDSILSTALGDEPLLAAVTGAFAIDPEVLPLAEGLPAGDPRAALEGFPRPGANGSVDAATHGYARGAYTYANGPAFRMAFALGPEGVQGFNILPGGQSALTDSPHFADQALLWLGNETLPARYTPDEVVAGALGRWVFEP